MHTIVRQAVVTDARRIAEINVEVWRAAYRGIAPDALLDSLSVADREPRWHAWIGDGNGAILVAERGQEVIGYCASRAPSRDEDAEADVAEIAALYVDAGQWRSGAGTALMTAALDHIRAGGSREVTLWAFAANARAIAFYRRHGFLPDGAETVEERTGATEIRFRLKL